MRTVLLAVAMLVAVPTVGNAGKADDYVACLIGQSAVALNWQEKKDTDAAQKAAFKVCKKPEGLEAESGDRLADLYVFVNLAVKGIAKGVWDVD